MKMNKHKEWSVTRSETFWRDIAPGEHVLQIYDNKDAFIDTLASFVGTGINAGESVIVIACAEHKKQLEYKLRQHVLQLDTLKEDHRLTILDADETLEKLCRDGMPDEELFQKVISGQVNRARGKEGRTVRAFGEMVCLLSEKGNYAGTRKLEELWSRFCREEKISLYCAYPRSVFEEKGEEHLRDICSCHTKIIKVTKKPLMEVMYQDVEKTA
jgi:hypothetical protein